VRNKKISADISKEANELLNALIKKHERSKGYLLEKMIRKFCVDVEPVKSTELAVVKKPSKKFTPPRFFDVDEYMRERKCSDPITQAEKFCDFYESKGWVVGKAKMKCWKAAVRNWLKGSTKTETKQIAHTQNLDSTDWAANMDDVL